MTSLGLAPVAQDQLGDRLEFPPYADSRCASVSGRCLPRASTVIRPSSRAIIDRVSTEMRDGAVAASDGSEHVTIAA